MIFEQRYYKAGIYLRLSKGDDNREGESNSIGTQRLLLTQYCLNNDLEIVDEYIDDDCTGMNFERDEFKRMISDALSGRINVVISKDLSRFGRDYIEGGQYIEKVFQKHNIRYVAVADGVDTLKNSDDITIPIKNVMNNLYSKDVSRKTKVALQAKAKDGQYLASKPPFGYVKSPADKHKLIIDEEAAEVVRRIFKMASEGYGYNKMARALEGTPTPNTYFMLKNPDYYKKPRWNPSHTWNNKSLFVILNNPIYLGNTVYGKTRIAFVGSNELLQNPQERWITAENTHEPIITQDLWEEAHAVMSVRRRATDESKEPHLFAGLIKCADCGSALMYGNRKLSEDNRGEFKCFKYSRQGKDYCKSHYITYNKVYNAVFNAVQELSRGVNGKEKQFLKRLEDESLLLAERKSKKAKADYSKAEQRIAALDQILTKLYEDSALGIISRERCLAMMDGYEKEQRELKEKLAAYDREKQEQEETLKQLETFTKIVKEATNFKALTASIVCRLINRIEIGHAEKNRESGRKEQRIRIIFTFSPAFQDVTV
ncbi:MAG: recombinase family protein [Oscillospiraceae bacterium]|jgi:DNA invertase Pin-like site-specific DNA recombinase|nr:recombinase family protein [Oscillospiraceae bacterium]